MTPFSLPTSLCTLQGQAWPVEAPRAILAVVHGHGEHIGRYDSLGQSLGQHAIAMLGYDLIGHGHSPGKRGHFPSYPGVLDSIEALLRHAQERYPEAPLFLMGHSLGGNLVANYVLRRKPQLRGVILSSPWLRLAFAPSSLDRFLAKSMVNVWPSFTQSSKLDASAISRLGEEVHKYQNDPQVHDLISPRLFLDATEAGEYALNHAAAWHLPLLHLHGDADRITSFEASQAFAQQAGGGQVAWKPWPGGYHELLNDRDGETVKAELITWLLAKGS